MNKKYIVAGIGELLWDCLPKGKQLGGAPCNFAYHARQSGCECFVVSAIGKDDLGSEIKKELQNLDLTGYYVQENDSLTSTVTVSLDENGQPDYTIHENVAWDQIEWNADLEILAQNVDAICFGSLAQRNKISRSTILKFLATTRNYCIRVFDINLRQAFYNKEIIEKSLEFATVLKLNEDELPIVARMFELYGSEDEILSELMKRFDLRLIALTKGANGSLLFTENEQSFMEVPKVKIADTVGAGDSFTAVLVAGLLQNIDLKKIHSTATEIAAFVCTQNGATPKYK